MKLNFRKVDPLNDEDLLVILKGMNDPEIQHLVVPNFEEKPLPIMNLAALNGILPKSLEIFPMIEST